MDYTKHKAEDFACDESFVRYYLRENEQDVFFWEKWIDEHPEKFKEIASARQMLGILSLGIPQNEFDEEFEKMKDYVHENISLENQSLKITTTSHTFRSKKKKRGLLAIAATLILIVASSVLVFYLIHKEENQGREELTETRVVKENSKGQKSLIHLPDGSVIRLNSSSEVSFNENFPGDIRLIDLKGEAFFDVAPDPQKPFIVRTENLSIKALGTSFNVNAYGESEALKVSLLTGKVEINIENDESSKSILEPGEGISFNRKSKVLTKGRFDPDAVLAWRRGIIYFKDKSWDEIVITLERWFDVEFDIKNQPRDQKLYSGQFENQSLELVLESLSFSKDFAYTINGKKILIVFHHNP